MNRRDRDLFNRGVVVGLKLAEEFGAGLDEDKPVFKKVSEPKAVKKHKKSKGKTFWDASEDSIIRLNPNMSIKELMRLLPSRSATSIGQRRWKLGVKQESKSENDGLAKLGQSEE